MYQNGILKIMFKKLTRRQEKENRETKNKMPDLSPNISIIIFHVNHLNIAIKGQTLTK